MFDLFFRCLVPIVLHVGQKEDLKILMEVAKGILERAKPSFLLWYPMKSNIHGSVSVQLLPMVRRASGTQPNYLWHLMDV